MHVLGRATQSTPTDAPQSYPDWRLALDPGVARGPFDGALPAHLRFRICNHWAFLASLAGATSVL